jgi:hypothetical protein
MFPNRVSEGGLALSPQGRLQALKGGGAPTDAVAERQISLMCLIDRLGWAYPLLVR